MSNVALCWLFVRCKSGIKLLSFRLIHVVKCIVLSPVHLL